jgi:hypothetical protein
MNMHTPLDANQRRAILRRAIAAHPGWEAYRTSNGLGTVATIGGVGEAEAICRALGLDPVALVAAEQGAPSLPLSAAPVAPAARPVSADPAKALEALQALGSMFGASVDPAQVKAMVEEALAPLRDQIATLEAPKPVVHVMTAEGAQVGNLPAMRHHLAETLLQAASARDAEGFRLNVWLAGPAGSGKTRACKDTAKAMGLDFTFHGAMTMAHELTGFVDAGGTYHPTAFVTAFIEGKAVLLDEVDAGSDEARLALNAALANGMMSLPDGRLVERHPDFVCFAAANTWGHGATAEYIGRAKIDAAFLDRFGARIAWDYDEELERKLSGDLNWAKRVQKARAKAREAGVKVIITPRATISGAALIRGGMTADDAARLTYLAGLTPEQARQVEG